MDSPSRPVHLTLRNQAANDLTQNPNLKTRNPKQIQSTNDQNLAFRGGFVIWISGLEFVQDFVLRISDSSTRILFTSSLSLTIRSTERCEQTDRCGPLLRSA